MYIVFNTNLTIPTFGWPAAEHLLCHLTVHTGSMNRVNSRNGSAMMTAP